MRGLILAIQFLTRLPTPQLRDIDPANLPRSAHWFPLVGCSSARCWLLPCGWAAASIRG